VSAARSCTAQHSTSVASSWLSLVLDADCQQCGNALYTSYARMVAVGVQTQPLGCWCAPTLVSPAAYQLALQWHLPTIYTLPRISPARTQRHTHSSGCHSRARLLPGVLLGRCPGTWSPHAGWAAEQQHCCSCCGCRSQVHCSLRTQLRHANTRQRGCSTAAVQCVYRVLCGVKWLLCLPGTAGPLCPRPCPPGFSLLRSSAGTCFGQEVLLRPRPAPSSTKVRGWYGGGAASSTCSTCGCWQAMLEDLHG
jgi:hypothetical protein